MISLENQQELKDWLGDEIGQKVIDFMYERELDDASYLPLNQAMFNFFALGHVGFQIVDDDVIVKNLQQTV